MTLVLQAVKSEPVTNVNVSKETPLVEMSCHGSPLMSRMLYTSSQKLQFRQYREGR